MKKCLKFISLAMVLVLLAAVLGACGRQPTPAAPAGSVAATPMTPLPAPEPAPADAADAADADADRDPSDVRIALIAHSPDSILDDGSFNEGAWAGIQRFASTHGLPSGNIDFFQPHSADDVARIDLIGDAIQGFGADILILPGFHFISSLYDAQDIFPDTKFVLLDATPSGPGGPRVEANVAAIHYAEHESGFLAGYAAVMEGHRNLGFIGGIAVPAVVRFGHGFLQGAEHAAEYLGLAEGDVTVNYYYIGAFAPSPETATMASAWYAGGVEVIFAAAGGAGASVKAGAEGAGGSVIGVDVDQAHLSPTVITSAIKALDVSVYDMLTDFLNGTFRGGRELMFDASVNGIGLPMHSARFQNFTQADYDAIFALLASGAVVVNNVVTETVSEANLGLVLVTVNELN